MHDDVELQLRLASHWEVVGLRVASPKHVKHFSGRFYSQVAQLSLHLKVHLALSADITYPVSHLEQDVRDVHSIQLTAQFEHLLIPLLSGAEK